MFTLRAAFLAIALLAVPTAASADEFNPKQRDEIGAIVRDYLLKHPEVLLDVSKERLEAAPGFDADNWPSMANEKWNRDVYKYYDRSPYWE